MNHLKLFECRGVTKVFDKSQSAVLKDVDLFIKSDECVGIIGESGCGKSTLARIMMHLVPLKSGHLFFKGKEITKQSQREKYQLYQSIQMVFQDPLSTFSPKMKIEDYMMEPLINFKLARGEEAKRRVETILNSVKLPIDYLSKYPHELSGGELQRIVIARALLVQPELIICDEATSALDMTIQKDIVALLKNLQEKEGFSILFITHDLALADQFCDRVYVMKNGKVLEVLETGNLIEDAKDPYTKAFFDLGWGAIQI